MEILAIYLYGIYESIAVTLTLATVAMLILSGVAGIFYWVNKYDYESHKDNKNSYCSKERIQGYKATYEIASKYILLKSTIALVVLNILMPPKEIVVAMVAINPTINTLKEVRDSNRTAQLVDILDLTIAKAKKELKENNE